MRELTSEELEQVSGAGTTESVLAISTAVGLANSTFGGSWATMAAVSAFGASPIVATAIVGLALYGGYQWFTD